MKIVVPALAAFIAAIGGSAAQAAVHHLDFGAVAIGGHITYTGSSLESSTALDLDSSLLTVSQVGSPDDSGLAIGDHIAVTNTNPTPPPPITDIVYGSGSDTASPPDLPQSLAFDVIKKWTATTASPG